MWGLQAMEVAGQHGEFLVLEYRDGDRVYVPVQSLHLITRYTGAAPENAPLHKLGTDQWRGRANAPPSRSATSPRSSSDLYARRRARQGLNIPVPELEYQNFANAFPFEETADQAEAIRQVLTDLESSRPMDRLICGDVGFGKTEVAMRAAFVTVQSGRQGGVARSDHSPCAAASHQFQGPLRRLAGAHRVAIAIRQRTRDSGDARGD